MPRRHTPSRRWDPRARCLRPAPVALLPLTSTSDVFIPPRGRGYQKFSFDFPEPSVRLPRGSASASWSSATRTPTASTRPYDRHRHRRRSPVESTGLVWAGGQEKAPGHVSARCGRPPAAWSGTSSAEMELPIKTVSTVIRGIPRGQLSFGAGASAEPRDDEVLVGYPFSGGDLFGGNTAGGMATPVALCRAATEQFVAISSLDDRVRTKRFFFQPGESGYRVEAIHEAEGWLQQKRLVVPTWRLAGEPVADAAIAAPFCSPGEDLSPQAVGNPAGRSRLDARRRPGHHPPRQHYTGYIFNDYARQLEILRWMATQIPASRVLVFLSAWDGRYYWDYPNYRVNDRMGGEAGFRRLVDGAHALGFRIMPMYGTNTANRNQPVFSRIADAAVAKIDGDAMDLNWVDWDNDRHQEGWLAYMNLGVDSWREWLEGRIGEMISRYGVDAYFLDIVGG